MKIITDTYCYIRAKPYGGEVAEDKDFKRREAAVESGPTTKKTFLVLEDSPNDAFFIGHAFSLLERCTSHICSNTKEAQAYLLGTGNYSNRVEFPFPHAVMSDLHLGPDSGIDFFNWMRGCKQFDSLPALLLTCSANPQELENAAKIDRVQVLGKPMDIESLKTIVDGLCESIQ
jgi:CheY-like chemotaxis protein